MNNRSRARRAALPTVALVVLAGLTVYHVIAGGLVFAALTVLCAVPVAMLAAQRWTGR